MEGGRAMSSSRTPVPMCAGAAARQPRHRCCGARLELALTMHEERQQLLQRHTMWRLRAEASVGMPVGPTRTQISVRLLVWPLVRRLAACVCVLPLPDVLPVASRAAAFVAPHSLGPVLPVQGEAAEGSQGAGQAWPSCMGSPRQGGMGATPPCPGAHTPMWRCVWHTPCRVCCGRRAPAGSLLARQG